MATDIDTGIVDAAIIAALRADSALMGLCPSGVFYGVANPGATKFVIVDQFDQATDPNLFAEAAGDSFMYVVKAVIPDTSSTTARQAALRIRAVLDGNQTLVLSPYALQRPMRHDERIRYVEVDPANPDRRVQHWGGHYSLEVEWTA